MGKTQSRLSVIITVLQNGYPVSSFTQKLVKGQKIILSSDLRSSFSIPLYPLVDPIFIGTMQPHSLVLELCYPWVGFVVFNQKTHYLDRDHRSVDQKLCEGDYANLSYQDLRIMIKVGVDQNDKIKPNLNYKSSLLSLYWRHPSERVGTGLGLFIACLLFFSALALTLQLKIERPHAFEDLTAAYTLPFIGFDHFKTAPEALKTNIDRTQLVSSIVNYYRDFTNLQMLWPIRLNSYLYPTSIKRHKELMERKTNTTRDLLLSRANIDTYTSTDETRGVILVPTVIGPASVQKLHALVSSVENLHLGLDDTLQLRRTVTEDFPNDPNYDWTIYRDGQNEYVGEKKGMGLKFSVFGQLNNEQDMYAKAIELGQRARMKQVKTPPSHESPRKLLITLSSRVEGVSYRTELLDSNRFDDSNPIRGGRIVKKSMEQVVVRAPTRGTLPRDQVEEAIRLQTFPFNLCYRQALRRDEKTEGASHFQITVGLQGRAQDVHVIDSSVKDHEMLKCLERQFYKINFPKPRQGSVLVGHTLVFRKRVETFKSL